MWSSIKLFITSKLMTLSSFFGVIVFYLISNDDTDIPLIKAPGFLDHFWSRTIAITLFFVFISWLSLVLAKRVFAEGNTLASVDIKPIENIAMPTYIGMFVIALEVSNSGSEEQSLALLALLLILWGLFERVFYFNPIWLFFGYRFYEVRTERGNTLTLISRRPNLKGEQHIKNLRKINEYTYMENGNG